MGVLEALAIAASNTVKGRNTRRQAATRRAQPALIRDYWLGYCGPAGLFLI